MGTESFERLSLTDWPVERCLDLPLRIASCVSCGSSIGHSPNPFGCSKMAEMSFSKSAFFPLQGLQHCAIKFHLPFNVPFGTKRRPMTCSQVVESATCEVPQ